MSNQAGVAAVQPAIGVRLAGTGMSVPEKVLTNADLERMVDTSDEWIIQRTGIRERHIAAEGETVRTFAVASLRQALENAGMAADELDMVFIATLTPEMCTPSTAARVVDDLGAGNAGALDISAACSGFVYGINMASSMIQTGLYRNIAVVGVETLTHLTNWDDRGTCILFGDGAGAAILSATEDSSRGCLHQLLGSDGSYWPELYCPRTEADIPEDDKLFTGKLNTLQMNGREIFKFAVSRMARCIDDCLEATGVRADELAMIIAHQSNARILEGARKRLNLPEEKLYVNIDRYGNTSAASVPLCLHELVEQKRIREDDYVLFVALGGGLTWAASLWRL